MLRRIDRVLAPITWVIAAFTVLVLLAGPSLIGAETDEAPAGADANANAAPSGEEIFVSSCGGCHTLSSAGTSGASGPNLDDLKPDAAAVEAAVRGGPGTMPAFEGTLSRAEIEAVAAFVAGEEPAAAAPTATATPAETAEVTSTSTGEGPDGITVSGDRVWVTNFSAGTLQRFDASTGEPAGDPIPVGRQPDNPVVAGGVVWLALSGDDAVARVEDGNVTRIPVGDEPEDLAVAGGIVWVTNAGDGTVTRIDGGSGQVQGAPIEVGERPLGIAADGDTVWVSSNEEGTVTRLDATTGAVRGDPIPVGDKPRGLAAEDGSAWVANSGDGSVTRLRDGLEIQVGSNPRDLAIADGTVWVANAADDTVTKIDAKEGELVGDPVKVGDDPIGIAVGGEAVWVTGFRDDTLSRLPLG